LGIYINVTLGIFINSIFLIIMSIFDEPFLGFRFVVSIPPFPDTDFKSVSGIKESLDTDPIYSGGSPSVVYHLPKMVKYEPLVLERGILSSSSSFLIWCDSVIKSYLGSYYIIPTPMMTVTLLGSDGASPLVSWQFFNAYPTALETEVLDASKDEVLIEKITFNYSNFVRL
jgi:phage tail-like protein